MRVRVFVLALAALFATSVYVSAQSQTGEIFGKATDQSGGVLPGVTVTLTGPTLLQPLTAVTSETGTYQFPRLEIGVYTVKFDLTGFKTVVNQDIRVTVGFSAQVNAQLGVSTVQETVTVTGQSPVVDTKETGTKQTFTNELLQSIPSARDPWVILQQTAGIAMDRENIGGNQSGQQSNYVSRGGNPTNNKWSLDGVDITDMAATGASPSYYDFDAFEEMTINTGGVDVTQQTGGVGINLVTKSGTDKFRGSSRYYETNSKFESQNVTDAMRVQGATSGNPVQDIKDYGFELGGPIKKGRAWIWGSFGKDNIGVGVVNFYQPTATCQAFRNAATALATPIENVNDCLNTDLTVLQATNVKAEVQLFKGNKLTLFNNFAKKERNARGADDLHPIETTQRQAAVPSTFGTNLWRTGPNPTYKIGDQWVLSDRLLLDVQWAHIANNFILDFHDDSLADVQPTLIISTTLNGRSGTQSVNIRPANSVNVNANYFMPAKLGGDHAFKVGGYLRDNFSESPSTTGGHAIARFPTSLDNDCAAIAAANPGTLTSWCQAQFTRDGNSIYDLKNVSAYLQDTYTHQRLTMQLGIRYDRNHDQVLAASVDANPLVPEWLPAVSFAGNDPKIVFNNFSPRLGATYDLKGNGRTIARLNYARYYGQVGSGGVASQVNPLTSAFVRFPWNDLNGDKVIQANEVVTGVNNVLSSGGNYNPNNPGFVGTANTIDPNLRNDKTDEFILGLDREIGAGFAAGVNYIWRRYGDFNWSDVNGLTSADYSPVNFTPPASACPAGSRCSAVTYFVPNIQLPTVSTLTNVPGYNRTFNGLEVTGRKRLANHWLMNTSFSYNSTLVNFGSFPGSVPGTSTITEDPTNRAVRDGFQYDYATAGSGIGNVFINSKYLFKLSGMYQAPFDINVSAFYNARQGYPFEATVQSPSRPRGAGVATVILDPIGENRLPNFQNLDFHVERPVHLATVRFIPSMDIFNVANSNTIQAIRGIQNAGNANNIQAIVAPRVIRFGVRFNW
jgi:carboxypeptidase family protein/TonB-dependent receptor-like protein